MRHFVGFFIGLVLTPAVVLAPGWSLPRLIDMSESSGVFTGTSGIVTIAVLSVLALVLALMVVPPRLTPLVPGVAGFGLIGLSAVEVLRPEVLERLPEVAGLSGGRELLALGLYLPLSLVLIVPLFVPSRWSGHDDGPDDVTEEEYFDGLYGDGAAEEVPRRAHRHRAG